MSSNQSFWRLIRCVALPRRALSVAQSPPAQLVRPLYTHPSFHANPRRQVYHLACPASPVHYKYNPIKTMKTGFIGTMNMLGLAKRCKARFLLTSTSEVYVVNVVFASAKIQRTPLVSPRSSHPNHLTDHLTDHPTDHPTDHLTHLTHGRPFQLRRPSRAPANRELFRERQLQRRTQLLRRGQARGRVSDDGLSPRTRPGGEDRPYF
mmetsp:Transcript_11580/g.32503  ORF Transcript_11580/g.32503 Transcript_11580/m.32503 type:complete len:207 (-) Transcript_11580:2802-3422(-)